VELGEGGTAKVFLAVARGPGGFNKLVVLKALKKHLCNDQELRASFLHEARLSARLNHPNVVQVNEVTELDSVPVIVMEYLQGRALSEIIHRAAGELTLSTTLKILSDALSGLHYCHELCDYDGTPLNLVHRDVTPQNVFVTFDGVVKMLDFGIAKVAGTSGDTEAGVIKGKLRYMPPEQIVGEPIDRRADIFAMGVMLWEAGARQRMWKNVPEAAIMNHVINGEIPSPRQINPECPAELERICLRALAHERDERYETAAAIQADVDALLSKLGDPVGNQEVGRRVAEWFADFRADTQRVVERKLAEDAALSITGAGNLSLSPPYSVTPGRTGRRHAPAGRLTLVLGLLGLLAVALALVFGPWRAEPNQPSALASPPVSSASAAEDHTISLRITVFPAKARISVDGKEVEANPHEDAVEPDGKVHEIVASAPGYVPVTRRIKLTRDIDMVLNLEEKPPEPVPDADETPRPARHPARPRPVETRVDCSTPSYLDERGVKKYRPECL
jgi:serine/threonine protein kinase